MLEIQPITILQIVFFVQVCFGAILIANQSRYQGLRNLLLLTATLLVFNVLEENNITRSIHLVTPIFSLLTGPLFFWFVHRLVKPSVQLTSRRIIHVLPALLCLPFTHWVQVILFLGTFSQISYMVFSIKLIRSYHYATANLTADSHAYRIDWLRKLLVVAVTIGVIDLVRLNLQPILALDFAIKWYFATQTGYLIMFSWMIYKSINQPELFEAWQDKTVWSPDGNLTVQDEGETAQAQSIFKWLDSKVINEHLYRLPRLTLRQLAIEVDMNEKDLSWAINCGGGVTFSDYINRLRINEVQAKIVEKPNANFLDLALAAGFNSKSTFNAVFKQQTGLTPTQYSESVARN
ncbi:helix-turn-helix transcriptional regulator [Aliikangiella marina]|uniref:Helix-turn-helix transcriptional regulator n=1 Tax=Aliikangiella marina TaxID=1712262 RepID=A0A545T4P3_9GAMM|nr:AraC family transcriptional regulator [Aliikangiella marina]TQV72199.1 helix-turn-helix transcriptional regulator [Aliikangiella marina]